MADPGVPAAEKMLVLDADAWGGRDKGDNSQFWKPATLLSTYRDSGDVLATVEWEDGRVTRGHFVAMMREIPAVRL